MDEVNRHIETSHSSSQSRKRSRGSGLMGRTKSTTPYSGEFEQKLIDKGIYQEGYEDAAGHCQEPANLDDLREALAKNRASMSPSLSINAVFSQFKRDNRRAKSESNALADVISAIAGPKDKEYKYAGDLPFTRLETFDKELSIPQPDRYYGTKPEMIDPRVRRDLDKYIIPSNQTNLPLVPNFFLEGKSVAGRSAIAQRQAMYDGAIGAGGVLQLKNYGNSKLTYDGNAYTITSTYHPSTGTLQMYATHPRQSQSYSNRTEYYMTQLDTYAMTGNVNSFRQGATAYRNARELMQQERDRFIAHANAVAQKRSAGTGIRRERQSTQVSVDNEDGSGSDTSMDELALEYDVKRRHKQIAANNDK